MSVGLVRKTRLWLVRRAEWRIIGLWALLWLVYHTQVLTQYFPSMEAASPLAPDLHFGYSPEHLRTDYRFWVQHRASFLLGHLLVDNLYPLIYGPLLALILTALRPLPLQEEAPWWALALPAGMMLADWSENLLLSLLMLVYPRFSETWAWMAASATTVKWTLLGGQLGCLVWSVVQRLRKDP